MTIPLSTATKSPARAVVSVLACGAAFATGYYGQGDVALSLMTAVLGSGVVDLLSRFKSAPVDLRRDPLTAVVGLALQSLLENAQHETQFRDSSTALDRMAKRVPKEWRRLVTRGLDAFPSLPGLQGFRSRNLPWAALAAAGETDVGTVPDIETWQFILSVIAEEKHATLLTPAVIETLAQYCAANFAEMLRPTLAQLDGPLQRDFEMRTQSEILALIVDLHSQGNKPTPELSQLEMRLAKSLGDQFQALEKQAAWRQESMLVWLGELVSGQAEVLAAVQGVPTRTIEQFKLEILPLLLEGREAKRRPITSKPRNILPSIGRFFVGREEEREEIADHFFGRAFVTDVDPYVIRAFGGQGKSRLAIEFAHYFAERYTALLYVIADTPASFEANLAALAFIALDLDLPADTPQDDVMFKVLRWLRANPGWLLIVDGVDSGGMVEAIVKKHVAQLPGGHLLITSRQKVWPDEWPVMELDVLEPEAAFAYLREKTATDRTPAADDAERAAALAARLDHLPLMLEQAAGLINRDHLTFGGYLHQLEDWSAGKRRLLDFLDDQKTGYPRSLLSNVGLALDQLSPSALAVLRICAFLAAEPIPRQLFRDGVDVLQAASDVVAEEQGRAPQQVRVEDSLAELEGCSLATDIQVRAPHDAIRLHRLLQEITELRLRFEESETLDLVETPDRWLAWLEYGLWLIDAATKGDKTDSQNWDYLEACRPHWTAVIETADRAGVVEPTARLMNQVSVFLIEKALLPSAAALLTRALVIVEDFYPSEDPVVGLTLTNLSGLLIESGRPEEAEPLSLRALQVLETSFGAQDPRVGAAYLNRAHALNAVSRVSEAIEACECALAIWNAELGLSHPEVAKASNTLAALCMDTERDSEVEPLLRHALSIWRENLGPFSAQVGKGSNNLAECLWRKGMLSESEELFRQALTILQESLGPEHPSTAMVAGNLASLLMESSRKRILEAESLARQSFRTLLKVLGPEHPLPRSASAKWTRILGTTGRDVEFEFHKLMEEMGSPLKLVVDRPP